VLGALTRQRTVRLATNAETADQSAIALDIFRAARSRADGVVWPMSFIQSTAGVMITLVDFEVLGEVGDPVCQDRHLDFG